MPILRLIKGRGGALLREKIVEQQARALHRHRRRIQDRRAGLGVGVLPVEVTPFARETTGTAVSQEMGLLARTCGLRDGAMRITMKGHLILDVMCAFRPSTSRRQSHRIREHAGVVETGFFPREATEAVIAGADGIRRMTKNQ